MNNKTNYRQYIKYIGQYVKRFYTPFLKENIFKIGDYREVVYFENGVKQEPISEFLYQKFNIDKNLPEEYWCDVEDSVIVTNEETIVDDSRIANVNDLRYSGFNPFK
jgi:hypothetical protein